MMIVLSDLHLTDETTAFNVEPSAFKLLRREIAIRASRRAANEIHVVLLGDIFDLLRTDYWMRHDVPMSLRPWGGELDPETGMNARSDAVRRQFKFILKRILRTKTGRALAGMLNSLTRLDRGVPHVTYVVGNHDRVLNNFPTLKARISRQMPGVHLGFKNSIRAERYGLLARHGHEWDRGCHGARFLAEVLQKGRDVDPFEDDAYRVMAIGEVLTAELMAGFIANVRNQIGGTDRDQAFLKNLKDVNNLRPMYQALSWIDWFTAGHGEDYTGVVRDCLLRAFDSFLDSSLAQRWRLRPRFSAATHPASTVRLVRAALKRGVGVRTVADLIAGYTRVTTAPSALRPSRLDEVQAGAKGEVTPATPYVVYGHTHVARHDDFHAEPAGAVQMYVNTGTYLPLVERALDKRSFVTSGQMTMLFFYNRDEQRRGAPRVDVWNGVRHTAA